MDEIWYPVHSLGQSISTRWKCSIYLDLTFQNCNTHNFNDMESWSVLCLCFCGVAFPCQQKHRKLMSVGVWHPKSQTRQRFTDVRIDNRECKQLQNKHEKKTYSKCMQLVSQLCHCIQIFILIDRSRFHLLDAKLLVVVGWHSIDIDLLFSTPYCLQNGELPSICTLEKRYTSKASPIESTMKGTRCKLWVWERISWFMQGLNLPWLLNGLIFGLPGWIFGLHWLRNCLWIQCRTSLDWSKTTYNRTRFHRAHSFLRATASCCGEFSVGTSCFFSDFSTEYLRDLLKKKKNPTNQKLMQLRCQMKETPKVVSCKYRMPGYLSLQGPQLFSPSRHHRSCRCT